MSRLDKTYTNGEVHVFWKPDLCIHCGNCARTLPSVFKPKEKPWVSLDGAITFEIIKTIANCPSGALSYKL